MRTSASGTRPSRRATTSWRLAAVVLAAGLPLVAVPTAAGRVVPARAGADHAGSGLAARTSAADLAAARARAGVVGGVPGMDVSGHQGAVDWVGAYRAGARFAIVKATEGTGYTNPYFTQQYNGSAGVGMVRGAYHFALPDTSSGTAQADYFLAHGGRWSADGRTLPPALDIEYNPYGPTCYGLGPAAMVSWLRSFVDTVARATARYPMIYTTLDWWSRCTGNSAAFGADPLWLARYNSTPGTMPAGWSAQTVWQYADAGPWPGDQDSFNGTPAQLRALAGGTAPTADDVSAVLPARVSVGQATTTIPVTVTTGEPHAQVTVSLRSVANGRTSATATIAAPTPTTRFTGSVHLSARAITTWGAQRWLVTTPDPAATTTVDVVLRARSLLGLRATRRGTTVTVTGAARAFDTATGRYLPWIGRRVLVQRWSRGAWITLTRTTTDSHGNLQLPVHIGFTAGLRLLDSTAARTWGAASKQVVV